MEVGSGHHYIPILGLFTLNLHEKSLIFQAVHCILTLSIYSYLQPALTKNGGIFGGMNCVAIIRCPQITLKQLEKKEKCHVLVGYAVQNRKISA